MSTFDNCLKFVLREEGPMTNDPRDPGGLTKFGISKRSHPDVDVANLTRDQAAAIYRSDYWEPTHCYSLRAPLALFVFDFAVNAGCERAIHILQEALDIPADGVFGPRTLLAANGCNPKQVLASMHDKVEAFYRGELDFDRFGEGWLKRNDEARDLALTWI